VWEVTNVFLVFFIVGIVGFFPDTAYYYGTALLIPGSIAIVLLAVRGSYYAFSHYGSGSKDNKAYLLLYGASGLFIPAALSTVLTISEGGFIAKQGDKVIFLYDKLFHSPYSWAVVLLALVSVLYISAMFLTFYADRAQDSSALEVVRTYALGWSVPTIMCSLLVFFAIDKHNPAHFHAMLGVSWMFVLSFLFFLVAVWCVWRRRRYGLAFVMVMLQFGFAFFGYGASHLPYILFPYVTLYQNFTSPTMAIALVVAFVLGLLLLVPSLWLLMRLFLFDAAYVQGRGNPHKRG
jgi:cytochrome d ubiquinol oxidase subunit II